MAGLSQIVGQERAKEFLKRVLAREKIPHAYLFTGTPGVGKTTTAKAVAIALNCLDPTGPEGCGQCTACRQIQGDRFPDFTVIEPDGKHIRIDQVREFNRMLGFAPAVGKVRVCVVQQAETMTPEAANSFLKTLEEPPPDNVIILSATEPLDLLPTIVSRCQRVSFQPVPAEEIALWLTTEKGESADVAEVLGSISEGSPGRAFRMRAGDFLKRREAWLLELTLLPALAGAKAVQMALQLVEKEKKGGTGEGGLPGLLGVWRTWYRDLMLVKTLGHPRLLINSDLSHQLKTAAERYTIMQLVQSIDAVERAERDLRRMLNPKLVMVNVALRLRGLTVGGDAQGSERWR